MQVITPSKSPLTVVKKPALKKIEIGDTVRIITPEFFIRCGYPMSKMEAMAKITNREYGLLDEFMKECKYPESIAHQFHKIMAYGVLMREGYGGDERKIHTETHEIFKNATGSVTEKKFVRTGTYYGSSGSGEDYEPGGLTNGCTHVILHLDIKYSDGKFIQSGYAERWIERKNVELI